jgi:peptide/nickel transport system substrate-binding protein
MGRSIRWQAIFALGGIVLVGVFLFSIASARTTVLVPDEGGMYVEGLVGAPQHINPLLAQFGRVDKDLVSLVFNGLTHTNGQDMVEPDLALDWTVSPDGITYLFKLRRDVRWSDGERFDADDVVFTIGLMQDPAFPGSPTLSQLWRSVGVHKVDDYTVRFQLTEPYPAFLDNTNIGMLPAHVLEGVGAQQLATHSFNAHPIGTGPFMLTEISTKHAVLVPNPRHFRNQQPFLSGIEFRFYDTHEQLLTAYQEGEILGISEVPPYLLPQAASIPTLNLYSARLSGYKIVYLNLLDKENLPFFQDVEVRTALLQSLDRQKLIDSSLNGQGLVANGPIRPWIWAYEPSITYPAYDPARAKSLLDEAAWVDQNGDGIREKDGHPLQFTLLTTDEPDALAMAEAMAAQWAPMGIGVSVETIEPGLGDRLAGHEFQAALVDLLLSGDPDPYPMWDQTQIDGGQNYGGWDNRQVSEALEQARRIVDQEERRKSYIEFQRIFAAEIPALIISYPIYTYAVDESIRQVQIEPMVSPSQRFNNIADWYMNTRRMMVITTPSPLP